MLANPSTYLHTFTVSLFTHVQYMHQAYRVICYWSNKNMLIKIDWVLKWSHNLRNLLRNSITNLFLKVYDVIKVGVVYMSINSKKPLQNSLCNCHKIPRKGNTYSKTKHKTRYMYSTPSKVQSVMQHTHYTWFRCHISNYSYYTINPTQHSPFQAKKTKTKQAWLYHRYSSRQDMNPLLWPCYIFLKHHYRMMQGCFYALSYNFGKLVVMHPESHEAFR